MLRNALALVAVESRPSIRRRGFRTALGLFVLLLIYDGAIRKWIVPGAEQVIFVIKDGLLCGLLMLAHLTPIRDVPSQWRPSCRMLFGLYALWVVGESFNPQLPNVLVGMWGIKVHILYASLVVLLPLAFESLDELLRTLEKCYAWAVTPVVLLALAQLSAPGSSLLNQQVRGGMEGVAYFGEAGLVRVAGTFSYISGMAAFVQVSALLGIALFLAGGRSKVFMVGLAFALLALPVTGSRGVVLVTALGALMLVSAALACRFITANYAIVAISGLCVLGAVSLKTQSGAWVAFSERAESSRADENRAITTFTNAFTYFDSAGPAGFGAGSASLGAPALAPDIEAFSWLPLGGSFEEESGRVVIELGFIGWVMSLAMRAGFLMWALALAVNGRTRNSRIAAVIALPAMALGVYQGNGVFAPPIATAYYWFCIGLLAMAQFETQAVVVRQRLRTALRPG